MSKIISSLYRSLSYEENLVFRSVFFAKVVLIFLNRGFELFFLNFHIFLIDEDLLLQYIIVNYTRINVTLDIFTA
jgi:hypothetical protein